MSRLFVALRLPDSLCGAVRQLQFGLRNARWLDEDSLHLTLAFIGEVDDSAQRRIEDALAHVTARTFRMELHGLGCFPPRGAHRVLWTGASPGEELASLARGVRRAIERAGLTPERRRFTPHVTIARFRRPPPSSDLQAYLGAHSLFRTSPADIASFHLFSSTLRSSGAQYTIEATYFADGRAARRTQSGSDTPICTGSASEDGDAAMTNPTESTSKHMP